MSNFYFDNNVFETILNNYECLHLYGIFMFLTKFLTAADLLYVGNYYPFPTWRCNLTHQQQTTLENIVKIRKLLMMSNFSFCYNVFNWIHIYSYSYIYSDSLHLYLYSSKVVCCRFIVCWKVLNMCIWAVLKENQHV